MHSRIQKADRIGMLWRVDHIGDWTGFDEVASVQDRDTIRHADIKRADLQDGAVLVEPVWSYVRRRNPQA